MSLYEFLCEPCQFKFEALRDMGDYKAKCPKCGELAEKVVSACNFSVGWRLTDASQERFGPRDEVVRDV